MIDDAEMYLVKAQNQELKAIIGILVEKLGGRVEVTRDEIAASRYVAKEQIGFTNVYEITSSRA